MRSQVAGESSVNGPCSPLSALQHHAHQLCCKKIDCYDYLAEAMAFLMAKKMLDARKNGGSPTPYTTQSAARIMHEQEHTDSTLDEWMARGLRLRASSATLNCSGTSLKAGIL